MLTCRLRWQEYRAHHDAIEMRATIWYGLSSDSRPAGQNQSDESFQFEWAAPDRSDRGPHLGVQTEKWRRIRRESVRPHTTDIAKRSLLQELLLK